MSPVCYTHRHTHTYTHPTCRLILPIHYKHVRSDGSNRFSNPVSQLGQVSRKWRHVDFVLYKTPKEKTHGMRSGDVKGHWREALPSGPW